MSLYLVELYIGDLTLKELHDQIQIGGKAIAFDDTYAHGEIGLVKNSDVCCDCNYHNTLLSKKLSEDLLFFE